MESFFGRRVDKIFKLAEQDAEKLALVSKMGTISLALRRLGEKDTAKDTQGPLVTDTFTSGVIQKVNWIMEKQKTNSNTVRVYSGSSIQNVPRMSSCWATARLAYRPA